MGLARLFTQTHKKFKLKSLKFQQPFLFIYMCNYTNLSITNPMKSYRTKHIFPWIFLIFLVSNIVCNKAEMCNEMNPALIWTSELKVTRQVIYSLH